MKARFAAETGSQFPQIVLEAENELEQLLMRTFVKGAEAQGLRLNGWGASLDDAVLIRSFNVGVQQR